MKEIKFELVGRNVKFDEIVREVVTLNQLIKGNFHRSTIGTFFSPINDNCEFIAARRYAGQLDQSKPRKEIYEDDIVHNNFIDRQRPGVVVFSNIHHAYIIRYPRRKTDSQDQWDFMHGIEHCLTIIGDIYENKELLK